MVFHGKKIQFLLFFVRCGRILLIVDKCSSPTYTGENTENRPNNPEGERVWVRKNTTS